MQNVLRNFWSAQLSEQ